MTKFTKELGTEMEINSPRTLIKGNRRSSPIKNYHGLEPHSYITDNIKRITKPTQIDRDIDDFYPILISSHAEYPSIEYDLVCRDFDDPDKELLSQNVNDMFFQVPENMMVVDPMNFGGYCLVNKDLDGYLKDITLNNLSQFIKNDVNFQESNPAKFFSNNMKIYPQETYMINFKIDFEKTSSKDENFWGIFEPNGDKPDWQEVEFTKRKIRNKVSSNNCTSLQSIMLNFYKHPEYKDKKLAFILTSCRMFPNLENNFNYGTIDNYIGNMENDNHISRVETIKRLQDFFIIIYCIIGVVNNGHENADKISKKARYITNKDYKQYFDIDYDNREDLILYLASIKEYFAKYMEAYEKHLAIENNSTVSMTPTNKTKTNVSMTPINKTKTNVSMPPKNETNQPSLFEKLVSYFQNNIMKIRESTPRKSLREYTTSRTKKRPRNAGKSTRRKTTIIKTQRKKK